MNFNELRMPFASKDNKASYVPRLQDVKPRYETCLHNKLREKDPYEGQPGACFYLLPHEGFKRSKESRRTSHHDCSSN